MAKKKKKKKVPLKKQLRRLEKKADKAFSEFVRAYTKKYSSKCPLCGVGDIQCCFHFIRRRRKILRWEFNNVVGACHRCNYIEYRDPDLSRAWFIKTRGVDLYLTLVEKSKEQLIPTLESLQVIVDKYVKAKSDLK